MKKSEVFKLVRAINGILNPAKDVDVSKRTYNPHFSYGLGKSLRILNTEKKDLEDALKHPEKWSEFEKERDDITRKYAVITDGSYVLRPDGYPECGEEQEKLVTEIKALEETWKNVLVENEKMYKEWETSLETDVALTLFKVKLEYVPSYITDKQMEQILDLID